MDRFVEIDPKEFGMHTQPQSVPIAGHHQPTAPRRNASWNQSSSKQSGSKGNRSFGGDIGGADFVPVAQSEAVIGRGTEDAITRADAHVDGILIRSGRKSAGGILTFTKTCQSELSVAIVTTKRDEAPVSPFRDVGTIPVVFANYTMRAATAAERQARAYHRRAESVADIARIVARPYAAFGLLGYRGPADAKAQHPTDSAAARQPL
jgi:phosphoenolpyruvate phosphomutase